MYRVKRSDTLVGTIEDTYNIDLHARSDMRLDTLLAERGFDSLSQFIQAYRGNLNYHARKRHLFLSYHAEDKQQVRGFKLMTYNPKLDIDFEDEGLQEPINSERAPYIKRRLREKIEKASIVLCMIGNGTAWREWVDWELNLAVQLGKGVCGARLKGSRGRTPLALANAPVAQWDVTQIIAAIECAAARRS